MTGIGLLFRISAVGKINVSFFSLSPVRDKQIRISLHIGAREEMMWAAKQRWVQELKGMEE